jgi:hypothetical protein
MNGKTELVASYRRSCFDKLSTNGLSGKQDLCAEMAVYFYLAT